MPEMNHFPRVCLYCIANYCDLFTKIALKRLNKTTYKTIPYSPFFDLITERSSNVLQFIADFFQEFKKRAICNVFLSPVLTISNDHTKVRFLVIIESRYHDVVEIDILSCQIVIHELSEKNTTKRILYESAKLTLNQMMNQQQKLLNFYPEIKSHLLCDAMIVARMHFSYCWVKQIKAMHR